MKRVLITGANSYIGTSFEKYAKDHYAGSFEIDTVDMIDGSWRQKDFSNYDIIFHVAGIAHADVGKVTDEVKAKYYVVNTDLAIETAKKAKADGVKQFVFMSSAIVYGDSAPYGHKKRITRDTEPKPANFYGDSKWQADKGVRELADKSFTVTVLRPPMIYGKGSKGNYPTLAKLAKKLPIFPDIKNERSMLYIENLCEFLCQVMLRSEGGIFWPQNAEYTSTSEMVREIAKVSRHKILVSWVWNWGVSVAANISGKIGGLANKAFGSMSYDQSMSEYNFDYRIVSLTESIVRTEKKDDNCLHLQRKALMLASVASMIDLFNNDNIKILIDLGYKVDVATNFGFGSITSQERVYEFKKELLERGIGVYNIPIPRSLSMVREMIVSYRRIKELVDREKYDIVHCHSPIGGVLCRLACRNVHRRGTRIIYTAHGFHFFKGAGLKSWLIYYPAEWLCSCFTDLIITINKEDYHRALKFRTCNVEYVPGIGIHLDDIREAGKSVNREEKRTEFGYEKEDFVFISIGQVSVRKNHEIVIRALGELKKRDDLGNIKYLIVGFGEEEEQLRRIAFELGLKSVVYFAGYRSDVMQLLYCADGFVFPSRQEGLPVALMEAMAVGLPIVASRIRGIIDLIDEKGGYLVEFNDLDGFAKRMKEIASFDTKSINSMANENMRVINGFSIGVVNKKMREIYESI